MTYYYILFLLAIVLGFVLHTFRYRLLVNQSNSAFSLFISTPSKKEAPKSSKIYLFIIFFLAALLIGLRSIDVGLDSHGYVSEYFDSVGENGVFQGSPEIVLNLIAGAVHVFRGDYHVFFIVHGLIVSFLISRFIYYNSSNFLLSVIVFLGMFFIQSMNLMREWLALAFGLNFYSCFSKKQTKRAVIYFVLAVLSHLTAVSLILIPIFWKIRDRKARLISLVVFLLLVFVLKDYLILLVIKVVPRYQGYMTYDGFLNSGEFNIKDLIFIAIATMTGYILYTQKSSLIKNNLYDIYFGYLLLIIISIAFSFCGQKYGIFHRVVYYYSSFLIVILPDLLLRIKSRNIVCVFLIFAMFIMLYRNAVSDNNGISDYSFFWQ